MKYIIKILTAFWFFAYGRSRADTWFACTTKSSILDCKQTLFMKSTVSQALLLHRQKALSCLSSALTLHYRPSRAGLGVSMARNAREAQYTWGLRDFFEREVWKQGRHYHCPPLHADRDRNLSPSHPQARESVAKVSGTLRFLLSELLDTIISG